MLTVNGLLRSAADYVAALVRVTALEARYETISFHLPVIDAGSGNKITGYLLGVKHGAGTIISVDAHIVDALVGSGGAGTINCEIDGTNVTGGVVTMAIGSPTQGLRLAGSTVTAANAFTASSVLDVEIAVGTAFTAGSVRLDIVILRS